jgi:hypothetical protein
MFWIYALEQAIVMENLSTDCGRQQLFDRIGRLFA